MLRGGNSATGSEGVPPAGGVWVKTCWDFLAEFVAVVQAADVVLACSQKHLAVPRSGAALPLGGVTVGNL